MGTIKIIPNKLSASDPEVIDYLRALLRKAINKEVEWLTIRGEISGEYLNYYYPEPGE